LSRAVATSLPPVSVLGIGALTPLGRDLGEIARRVGSPVQYEAEDRRQTVPADRRHGLEARATSEQLPSTPTLAKRLRRADHFVRMAVMAATDAAQQARQTCAGVPSERIGLIVTSGLGPHCRGFRFLDGLLDCGDTAASPTDFSHSVHGAAAAYITELLELRGPSISTTDFEAGFESGVLLAQCWLAENACQRVLVGAVEELGDVLLHCASRLRNDSEQAVAGEGAVFLMLGPRDMTGTAHLDASAPRLKLENPAVESQFGRSASLSAFALLAALLAPRDIDTAAKSLSIEITHACP
jgi:hypothetical protein